MGATSPPIFDEVYLKAQLLAMLNIPSPSGYTDEIVHHVCGELSKMKIPYHVTRRGAIRATLPGIQSTWDRAVCVHLDTLGSMVRELKSNGRLAMAPIGTWSSRFAAGARVTVYTDHGQYRGTVLPLMASGHLFGHQVDEQPVSWDQMEIRIDAPSQNQADLAGLGVEVGNYVAFDARPEIDDATGFINARHLDDKAGAAVVLTVAKAIMAEGRPLPMDCHLLFTIHEEIGIGATEVLYSDITEMVVVDCAMVGPGQNSSEHAVTLAMMDQTGPFDYHLNRKLATLCRQRQIPFKKDVFRYYRSDSASAIESGSDVRTALLGFGVDATHGLERTHMDSLVYTGNLLHAYIGSDPTVQRDKDVMGSLTGFPHQPARDPIHIKT